MHTVITLVENKNKSFRLMGLHLAYEFHIISAQLQLHLPLTQEA